MVCRPVAIISWFEDTIQQTWQDQRPVMAKFTDEANYSMKSSGYALFTTGIISPFLFERFAMKAVTEGVSQVLMTKKNILLTGQPGIGKTTVIKELSTLLGESACGFYTAEVRQGKHRQGFEIIALEKEKKALLAHVDFSTRQRVGKYGVDPDALLEFMEEINWVLQSGEEKCLLLDEIGKMEFFTPGFKEMVQEVLDSSLPLVATIMWKSHPFCDPLKKRPDVLLVEVTRDNREHLPRELFQQLKKSMNV